jgi:hypothetical protein
MSLDGGALGVRHRGNDSAESTLPDSTAVLAVLPLNRRQHVEQHSVNRFESRLCNKKPRGGGGGASLGAIS